MDHSAAQLEALYQEALLFAQDKQSRTVAAQRVAESTGMALSSAKMVVTSFRHLIRGERYRRALNGPVTEAFLDSIHRDFGLKGLADALRGLQLHIEYYESFSKGTAITLRQIYGRFSALLTVDEDVAKDFPNEVQNFSNEFIEGSVEQVLVNKYERSREARQACLDVHGYVCAVCNFDFSQTYGELGDRFIHVHHLIEISSIGVEYKIDPKKDLRPVCPNCHAMLHRRTPALKIQELQSLLLKE